MSRPNKFYALLTAMGLAISPASAKEKSSSVPMSPDYSRLIVDATPGTTPDIQACAARVISEFRGHSIAPSTVTVGQTFASTGATIGYHEVIASVILKSEAGPTQIDIRARGTLADEATTSSLELAYAYTTPVSQEIVSILQRVNSGLVDPKTSQPFNETTLSLGQGGKATTVGQDTDRDGNTIMEWGDVSDGKEVYHLTKAEAEKFRKALDLKVAKIGGCLLNPQN